MTILFDRLAYMDRLKRAGLSEEQARAYHRSPGTSLAFDGRQDRSDTCSLVRIESKLDGAGEIRKKAFWKAGE